MGGWRADGWKGERLRGEGEAGEVSHHYGNKIVGFVPAEQIPAVIYKHLIHSNINKISLAKSGREILAYSLIISHLQITVN